MKKLYTGLFLSTFISGIAIGQQTVHVNFAEETATFTRKETEDVYPIIIKAGDTDIPKELRSLYTVTAKVNEDKSTLDKQSYKLEHNIFTLDKISSEYTFYLTLKKDSISDRDRHLYLILEISKSDTLRKINKANTNQTLDLVIKSVKALNKYNYLAYVGTNFDLVDGVKAENLFFATNFFVPPQQCGKGFGFNLTLYGNRTLTTTDTSSIRYTSKIVAIGGDVIRSYKEEAKVIINRVSDNLGATFSPLIRIGLASNVNRATQLYYAPQFEFIWRRSKRTVIIKDRSLVDSVDIPNRPITGSIILGPPNLTSSSNIYDVYLGILGLMLNHENDYISIRVQSSVGYHISYTPQSGASSTTVKLAYNRVGNSFVYARAWITEPFSGITFGAEVSNNLFKNYQPYYNVTLSKAIRLDAMAAVFQPVTSR